MGFTTPCLIKKITPELRVKLESIGYRYINTMDYNPKYILTTGSGTYYILEEYINSKDIIDCGDNEDLFLAIAALRDDSDKNQWFWYNEKLFKCIGGGSTVLMNGDHSIKLDNEFGYWVVMKSNVRKATVEELIEHFKK